jgi:hypothetical protein
MGAGQSVLTIAAALLTRPSGKGINAGLKTGYLEYFSPPITTNVATLTSRSSCWCNSPVPAPADSWPCQRMQHRQLILLAHAPQHHRPVHNYWAAVKGTWAATNFHHRHWAEVAATEGVASSTCQASFLLWVQRIFIVTDSSGCLSDIDTYSVMNDPPSGHWATPCCIYALHPYWAMPVVTFPP